MTECRFVPETDIGCTSGQIHSAVALSINQTRLKQNNRHIYLLLKKNKHFILDDYAQVGPT